VQDVTGCLTAVNDLVAVLYPTTVDGVRHRYLKRSDILRTALVHAAAVLDAFGSEPHTRFVNGHHFRLEFLGQGNCVVDVIEVGVRNQNGIDTAELMILRIFGIAVHPGIHDNDFAGVQAKLKRSVAEPRNLDHFYKPFVGCVAGS
jgi:hypothetical protein